MRPDRVNKQYGIAAEHVNIKYISEIKFTDTLELFATRIPLLSTEVWSGFHNFTYAILVRKTLRSSPSPSTYTRHAQRAALSVRTRLVYSRFELREFYGVELPLGPTRDRKKVRSPNSSVRMA